MLIVLVTREIAIVLDTLLIHVCKETQLAAFDYLVITKGRVVSTGFPLFFIF